MPFAWTFSYIWTIILQANQTFSHRQYTFQIQISYLFSYLMFCLAKNSSNNILVSGILIFVFLSSWFPCLVFRVTLSMVNEKWLWQYTRSKRFTKKNLTHNSIQITNMAIEWFIIKSIEWANEWRERCVYIYVWLAHFLKNVNEYFARIICAITSRLVESTFNCHTTRLIEFIHFDIKTYGINDGWQYIKKHNTIEHWAE